ncbi:7-cyano-7-deazaguanine synthase QueC [Candidatus Ichthyocystis hellenicum]|uniref:7-cyano-7-deazaguanine synthase QueC n=1 Tax=Candidatus Ichthyocystis hellenicum TaxID=1561003 RepID=UPI000B89338E|nr:7-cyano-7-deazaguanine synthase QueC [Candidatus Ichthyocystis hellenicum]
MSDTSILKKGVILLSGGMDSAVLLAYLVSLGYDLCALSFYYGQRSRREVDLAKDLASSYGVSDHWIQSISLPWGGSSLMDSTKEIAHELPQKGEVPDTYVPFRNSIFLSFALSCAEAMGINKVFIGANEQDCANYPDCKKGYFDAYNALIMHAVPLGVASVPVSIEVPFISFYKSDIVSLGHKLGLDFSKTLSCYQAVDGIFACGSCSSCLLRRRAFELANVADTTCYASLCY